MNTPRWYGCATIVARMDARRGVGLVKAARRARAAASMAGLDCGRENRHGGRRPGSALQLSVVCPTPPDKWNVHVAIACPARPKCVGTGELLGQLKPQLVFMPLLHRGR